VRYKLEMKLRSWLQIRLLQYGFFLTIGKFRLANVSKLIAKHQKFPSESIAILVQGPVIKRGNFTYKAISYYQKLYPKSRIILSTWINESDEVLSVFRDLGIEVVLSKDVYKPGHMNINRQIVSTRAGLEICNSVEYVLKTRTDVILRSPSFLEFLFAFYNEQCTLGRKGRIIITSFNTYFFRPYSFNDQLQFGSVNDLKNFWSCPLDERIQDDALAKRPVMEDWSKLELSEVWLVRNYLKFLGLDLPMSVEGSLIALRDLFIVLDESALSMYWLKSALQDLQDRDRYAELPFGPRVEQSDWMLMQLIGT
jgi:WavE lipopolysaccharide synthesis